MKLFLSGNEAIAFGLVAAGVRFIVGYPGTPSSEVIPTAIQIKKRFGIKGYFEWSVNEKVAMEESIAASYSKVPSAVVMKQVGLNVAMDPYVNAALVGSPGGLVIVVADDPGPHSSQTEQDSRMLAEFAKIPVLEPSTPKEAYIYAKKAIELSRLFEIPVMLRTTTRVSHSREDIEVEEPTDIEVDVDFKKDVDRFAATPHFRYLLHKKLNEKIERIKSLDWFSSVETFYRGETCILTSGISFAYLCDIIEDNGLQDRLELVKVRMPYPLNINNVLSELKDASRVVVIEEGYPVIERQVAPYVRLEGRLSGLIPKEGELTIDVISSVLRELGVLKKKFKEAVKPPFKRPSLCPGCGHRSAFFAIKQVFKNKAIYTGDIGCYTLGLNLGAVDTVHCMGASVSFAFGFDKAFELAGKSRPIVATIGDSTFFHSGIPPLIDAIHNGCRFILVILNNNTVAMTGNQTTPANEENQSGRKANPIKIEDVVMALGVRFLRVRDAYDIDGMIRDLKEADKYTEESNMLAVLIFRHPCVYTKEGLRNNVRFKDVYVDKDRCTGCKLCVKNFECPSLIYDSDEKKVHIDVTTCIKCGQCAKSCPFEAIVVVR